LRKEKIMNQQETGFPKTFVVVLNYNGCKDTVACVESLLRLDPPAARVVVVDNASSDGSVQQLCAWARGEVVPELSAPDAAVSAVPVPKPVLMQESCSGEVADLPTPGKLAKVTLIRNSENRGYAAGNNVGIRYALAQGADAVWILNNDTVVRPDALGAMVSRLYSKDRPGLCGSLIRYFHDSSAVQCRAGGFTNRFTLLSDLDGQNMRVTEALAESEEAIEQRLNFIYGASVLATRDFVDCVGLMDEGYFLYCEEQDWAFSAAGRFDLAYASQAHVFHKEGNSTGWSSSSFSPRMLYWLTRSRLRLAVRHNPWTLPTVVLGIAFAGLRLLLRNLVHSRRPGKERANLAMNQSSTP
jgi:GT2 family glycosyltransferase